MMKVSSNSIGAACNNLLEPDIYCNLIDFPSKACL